MSRAQLSEWNRTELDYPRGLTIDAAFEQQVAHSPERVAIISGSSRLTYSELNDRAELLSRRLIGLGVHPETLVGLALRRTEWLVIAMLAILKAGAAYVPLDPGFPSERLALMIEDSGMSVLLSTDDVDPNLCADSRGCITIDVREAVDVGEAEPETRAKSSPHDLAYVMYTSGSTGKPKGVMVEHRNVINFFAGMDHVIGRDAGVWLAVTSVSFDISILELLWTLTRGFTVVLHTGTDFTSVADEVERHRVTHIQMTPSLARMLMMDQRAFKALGSLQSVLLGGEAVPASVVRQLRRVFHGTIHNMYGPTETTIWSTSCALGEVEDTVSIGTPIANTQIYILDADLQAVPIGEPGELFIAGDGVARGYWNRPELTAERFIAQPWAPDKRMYRTGDLARFQSDGNIEFLGRADYQIKLRGHRIEPGEIENALEKHPGVRQAVVVMRQDRDGDARLVAYVVALNSQSATSADLKVALGKSLPDYMIPSLFVFVSEMPLTSNGKVDRKVLVNLPLAGVNENPTGSDKNSRPSDELEAIVAAAWAKALGVSTIEANDNFFDMGAHSLTVAEVHSRLQNELHCNIQLLDLYQYTTIRALAARLAGTSATNGLSDRAQRRRMARTM